MLKTEKSVKGFIISALTITIGLIVFRLVSKALNGATALPEGMALAAGRQNRNVTQTKACQGSDLQACEDFCTNGQHDTPQGLGGTFDNGSCTWSGTASGSPYFGSSMKPVSKMTSFFTGK